MFAAERQRLIKKLLMQNRHVTVSELSAYLNVSDVTIRKDLEKLENESYLTRTHGGAIIHDWVRPESEEQNYDLPEDSQQANLEEMSKIALRLIAGKRVIYLDGGPVCQAIAKKLDQAGELSVLTCDLAVAMSLRAFPNVQVIVPGGVVSSRGRIQGPNSVAALKGMYVELAFAEVQNFTVRGFFSQYAETRDTLQLMESTSDQMYFLCQAECFGQPSLFLIGELSMADGVITTADISPDFKSACADRRVRLYTAFNL